MKCPYTSPPHRHWWLEGYWCCYAYGHRHAPGYIAKAYQTAWLAGYDDLNKSLDVTRKHDRDRRLAGLHAMTPVTAADRRP